MNETRKFAKEAVGGYRAKGDVMTIPPNRDAVRPFPHMASYLDPEVYFCAGIKFDPGENSVGQNYPPYIEIEDKETGKRYYFEIPGIIAYYAVAHAGYTRRGRAQAEQEGYTQHQNEVRDFLAPFLENLIKF